MREQIVAWWYQRRLALPLWLLVPLSWLFTFLAAFRRGLFKLRLKRTWRAPVPVIIVGNVTVGGTGKTPTVLAVVELLRAAGFRPGIIARGYGGAGPFPLLVTAETDPLASGDEPLMLARLSDAPVAVAPKRPAAARLLLETTDVDVLVADDGLQHYALARDIEIGVVDGQRGFGNRWRLPAGPLRESVRRLRKVDWVMINGGLEASHRLPTGVEAQTMTLDAVGWRRVKDDAVIEVPDGETGIAIAGIGHPERFFEMVRNHGITIDETRVYPDHYAYDPTDFYNVSNQYPVLMTEKDAVKVKSFARPHWYYLKVAMTFPESFPEAFIAKVKSRQAELRSLADAKESK